MWFFKLYGFGGLAFFLLLSWFGRRTTIRWTVPKGYRFQGRTLSVKYPWYLMNATLWPLGLYGMHLAFRAPIRDNLKLMSGLGLDVSGKPGTSAERLAKSQLVVDYLSRTQEVYTEAKELGPFSPEEEAVIATELKGLWDRMTPDERELTMMGVDAIEREGFY